MMRPMKLGGKEIIFGEGVIQHIGNLPMKRASIIIGGSSTKKNGTLQQITDILKEREVPYNLVEGITKEPTWSMVGDGAKKISAFQPDFLIAVGGGSVLDAAKAMWVLYEHPEIDTLEKLLTASPFPKLRAKALMCCVPTTSGTASEVSRSIVITDDKEGMKHGLGNMEMMPDYAICDPTLTVSMPPSITAATGMDALTHAVEAYVSKRANRVSDLLAKPAIESIVRWLPVAYEEPGNMEAREEMLVASMVAGLSFTNVSLGITHSISHTLGGYFHLSHGLLNAILLPYVIDFNRRDPVAKRKYEELEQALGVENLAKLIRDLNRKMNIPKGVGSLINDPTTYQAEKKTMAEMSKSDGCTKTNPIIPDVSEFAALLDQVY